MRSPLDPEEKARIEALLHCGAEFEPAGGIIPALDLDTARARARQHVAPSRRLIPAMGVMAAGALLIAGLLAPHKASAPTPVRPPNIIMGQNAPQPHPITPHPAAQTVVSRTPRPRPHFAILTTQHHAPHINWRVRMVRNLPEAPRVHWHNETVVMVGRGIMTPGWVVHPDDSDDSIVAEPAVLSVPIQSAEAPVRRGVHIQPSLAVMRLDSQPEENP